MTKQDALVHIREHLTKLHEGSNVYEDGICNIIRALEEHMIPVMEKGIKHERLIESIFEKKTYYNIEANDT